MEQENRNQQNAAPQVSLGDQIKVRREKLAQLQAEGMDPFTITRFVSTTTAQEIKDHFDEMEGKPVSIAGRLMSKRGMGKVSFCDLQDKTGRIQLYARKDEMDEARTTASRNTTSAISSASRARSSAPSAAKCPCARRRSRSCPNPCCRCPRSSTA